LHVCIDVYWLVLAWLYGMFKQQYTSSFGNQSAFPHNKFEIAD